MLTLSAAQLAAARRGDAYVAAALASQGATSPAAGVVAASALAGIASDGRPLVSLLLQPAIRAVAAIGHGAPVRESMTAGRFALDMIVRTQLADAGRVAEGVAVTANEDVTGYVRLLVPPSCSRCIILAGRVYEWNAGFERHPKCNCRHIPANEDVAGDLRTDPKAYFNSLDPAEQARIFTNDGAQAIRDGADMNRVVNARRGMETAARAAGGRGGRLIRRNVFGRDLFTTTEAVTKRGVNRQIRLMPESIYELAAGNRGEALRLLRAHGYIT
ncbi:MAG: hypothetical protein ACRD0P_28950 [Stackebrandtia sp.]